MAVTSWLNNSLADVLDIGVLEGPEAGKPDYVLVVVKGSRSALADRKKARKGS